MAHERVSVSIPTEHAELIRRAAARLGLSLSAFVDKAATDAAEAVDLDRGTRTRELFAEWDARNAEIMERAAQMTDEELWGDVPDPPEEKQREIEEAFARADALAAKRRRS